MPRVLYERAEAMGKELRERALLRAVGRREHDRHFGIEFRKHLPARAARAREHAVWTRYRNRAKLPHAARHGRKDRIAFGAHRKAVTCIFYIARGEHVAIRRL